MVDNHRIIELKSILEALLEASSPYLFRQKMTARAHCHALNAIHSTALDILNKGDNLNKSELSVEYTRCKKFIEQNGWTLTEDVTYIKGELCAIDLFPDCIVLRDDTGDFLHLPLNYFALLGALLDYRQISVSYITVQG